MSARKEAEGIDTAVTVVGGGVGGLVLARVLSQAGVRVQVLERDAGPDARTQGGSLDLRPTSGQRALLDAGLIDGFHRHSRVSGQEIRIYSPDGVLRLDHSAPPVEEVTPTPGEVFDGAPEIDRPVLRRLLLDSLPDGTVQWGCGVTAIEPVDGGHRLRLEDGGSLVASVLVGADGAGSRVRPLLTDAAAVPAESAYVELWLRDLDARPDLAERVGAGSLWCLGECTKIGVQRVGTGDARLSVSWRTPAPPAAVSKADLLDRLSGWDSSMTDLIAATEGEPVVRRLAATPVGATWASRPDVTLIGDAAHLMPPVGEGANQAMLDGAELGRLLADHPAPKAIATFERSMHERVRPVAEQSRRIAEVMLAPDALAQMVGFFGAAS